MQKSWRPSLFLRKMCAKTDTEPQHKADAEEMTRDSTMEAEPARPRRPRRKIRCERIPTTSSSSSNEETRSLGSIVAAKRRLHVDHREAPNYHPYGTGEVGRNLCVSELVALSGFPTSRGARCHLLTGAVMLGLVDYIGTRSGGGKCKSSRSHHTHHGGVSHSSPKHTRQVPVMVQQKTADFLLPDLDWPSLQSNESQHGAQSNCGQQKSYADVVRDKASESRVNIGPSDGNDPPCDIPERDSSDVNCRGPMLGRCHSTSCASRTNITSHSERSEVEGRDCQTQDKLVIDHVSDQTFAGKSQCILGISPDELGSEVLLHGGGLCTDDVIDHISDQNFEGKSQCIIGISPDELDTEVLLAGGGLCTDDERLSEGCAESEAEELRGKLPCELCRETSQDCLQYLGLDDLSAETAPGGGDALEESHTDVEESASWVSDGPRVLQHWTDVSSQPCLPDGHVINDSKLKVTDNVSREETEDTDWLFDEHTNECTPSSNLKPEVIEHNQTKDEDEDEEYQYMYGFYEADITPAYMQQHQVDLQTKEAELSIPDAEEDDDDDDENADAEEDGKVEIEDDGEADYESESEEDSESEDEVITQFKKHLGQQTGTDDDGDEDQQSKDEGGEDCKSEGGWVSDGDSDCQSVGQCDLLEEAQEEFDLPPILPPRTQTTRFDHRPQRKRQCQNGVIIHRVSPSLTSAPGLIDDDGGEWESTETWFTVPKIRKGYAFPRKNLTDIDDVIDFWDTDFQVRDAIIPKMSAWENIGIVPLKEENASHYNKYAMFKALYDKWTQCHKDKEQWFNKYYYRSLRSILQVKCTTVKSRADSSDSSPAESTPSSPRSGPGDQTVECSEEDRSGASTPCDAGEQDVIVQAKVEQMLQEAKTYMLPVIDDDDHAGQHTPPIAGGNHAGRHTTPVTDGDHVGQKTLPVTDSDRPMPSYSEYHDHLMQIVNSCQLDSDEEVEKSAGEVKSRGRADYKSNGLQVPDIKFSRSVSCESTDSVQLVYAR